MNAPVVAHRQGEAVIRWRQAQLTEAGFAPVVARDLASDPRWDLHAVLQLVERGCPPLLAARILAPEDTPAVEAVNR